RAKRPAALPAYYGPPFPPMINELVVREGPQRANTEIEFRWQGASLQKENDDTYAADVFSTILNQRNNRFQKNLVDKRLAYQTMVGYYSEMNVGPISINAYVPIPATNQDVKAIQEDMMHGTDP